MSSRISTKMPTIFSRINVFGRPKNFTNYVSRVNASGVAKLKDIIETELESIRQAGTWKHERIITSKQDANITVKGQTQGFLNFCANNYLGLSSHPAVVEAGREAYSARGAGVSSSRFICGTQDIHKDLEAKIAKFHDKEEAILYASCFDANAGLFEAILNKDDAIISDELNHASIIDGIRLCKAERYRYKNTDMEDLEKQLQEAQGARMRMIATDGVFSMDGSVVPLREIRRLADKYDALLFVDECHASGLFGKRGRGVETHFDMVGSVDIINSTLGKALGGAAGGYTVGSKQLIDLLRNRSRPYLFSNSVPPPIVASASKALDILFESSELTDKLNSNTKHFRKRMGEAGFNLVGDPDHPICPVMLGDAKLATQFAEDMLERGIYVIGFSYPVVSPGKARIRVQISAVHTPAEIDRAVDMFVEVGRKHGVIP